MSRPRGAEDAGPPAITVEVIPEAEQARLPATGAVSSLQAAELGIPVGELERLWNPAGLERLAQSYWLYLRRASLGAIRVRYGATSRTVVLGRLPLLRFAAPQYAVTAARATVTWRIERGLLVAAEGRGSGWLRIELRRDGGGEPRGGADGHEGIRVAVEVQNFYPWLRGRGRLARFGAWVYSQTQVRVHRRLTLGFLRSLAGLELARHGAGE